jgi:hypothetical protein
MNRSAFILVVVFAASTGGISKGVELLDAPGPGYRSQRDAATATKKVDPPRINVMPFHVNPERGRGLQDWFKGEPVQPADTNPFSQPIRLFSPLR